MWFFTISTIKTVDDHSGYAFPWDPLQHVTANNSAYHDIHHQSWGIKNNFSQPFFIFWDRLMGTQWKGEAASRYERSRAAAQKQIDLDNTRPDVRLETVSASQPASFEQGNLEYKKITKEVDEVAVRVVKSQGIQARTHTRSVPTEGLDRVGHLVTGSIRQK
jgi:sphinganine C4-monooxygenase